MNTAACDPVSAADLTAFVRTAGMRAGLAPEAADRLAEPLVLADMMGVHTHGTKLLVGYLRKLAAAAALVGLAPPA
jgi:LDH2 family malate/lactate/ureidoglycolate dehydrogenase